MQSMKYICPRRCHANDKGGICPKCGRRMKSFGRIDINEAQKKIEEEQLANNIR